jgi:RNA polymerase sigma factor (sigma-70 family)
VTLNLTDSRRRWLSELYEANSAAVFNLCRRLLNSREDAADATHEVFLRAAASLDEPPDSPQARGWLMTVARNHSIDIIRRRERLGTAMITLAATADAGGDAVEAVEDRELLLAVLRELGVRDREALWQSAVERRPLAEIARSFDLSYTAAAQLLSRARRRALLVAARLAVILGLAQLGRAVRRQNWAQRGQQLAAGLVVPIMVAAVVVSSSPHAEMGVAATSQAGVPYQGPSIGHRSTRVIGQLPGTGPSTAPAPTGTVAPAAPVAQVLGVQTVPPVVILKPSPPPPFNTDVDHGKGRDRDGKDEKKPGNGTARGHNK